MTDDRQYIFRADTYQEGWEDVMNPNGDHILSYFCNSFLKGRRVCLMSQLLKS